jgi:hypothetical protein
MNSAEQRYAGFNLTSSKLQVAELSVIDNQLELVNIDEVFLNEEINFGKDKVSKIGALIQSAYQELQLNSSVNPSFISFCLPLELFSIIQLPYDNRISFYEATEDFRLQYSILYPFLQSEITIKFYEAHPSPFSKNKTAIVFGIETEYIKLIENFAKENHLILLFVDNPLTASNIALLSSNQALCKGYYLNIYLQKKIVSYVLNFNQKVLRVKSFNYNRIGDIPELLNEEFNSEIFSKIDTESLSSSFISGDELSPNLVSLLRKSLNIDFILFNPFDKLKTSPRLFDNKLFLKKYNSFAPSVGIALRLN